MWRIQENQRVRQGVRRVKRAIFAMMYHSGAQLVDVFNRIDHGNSGVLTLDQLSDGLRELGIECSTQEARALCGQSHQGHIVSHRELIKALRAEAEAYIEHQQLVEASFKVLVFIFIGVPILLLGAAALFGSLLALVEGWAWTDSVLILIQEILQVDGFVIVSGEDRRTTPFGKVLAIIICTWELAFFGFVLAVLGGPVLVPIIEKLRLSLSSRHVVKDGDHANNDGEDINRPDGVGLVRDPLTITRMTASWVFQIKHDTLTLLRQFRDSKDDRRLGGSSGREPTLADLEKRLDGLQMLLFLLLRHQGIDIPPELTVSAGFAGKSDLALGFTEPRGHDNASGVAHAPLASDSAAEDSEVDPMFCSCTSDVAE